MNNNNNLPKLTSVTLSNLAEMGYSQSTINTFKWTYGSLKKFCAGQGIACYEENIGELFLDTFRARSSDISNIAIQQRCRHIQQLNCTLTGTDWKRIRYGRKMVPYASSCYNKLILKYEDYLLQSGKTSKDIRSRIHIVSCFLQFAEQRGCLALSDLITTDVYAAFQSATDKGRFRRLVGAFLKYAYKYKLTNSNLYLVMPSVVRHQAVPSVYSVSEVEQLLESVDRTTGIGKRDYAIVLIAARLGLRASDIAGMTFDCLCEATSTINIIQAKTKRPLILPLLDEVKSAIIDYINEVRPISQDTHIFLNMDGMESISPTNVGQVVERGLHQSGIDCGKRRVGSHSLRASLATALLGEGVNYSIIQRVLGQSEVQSTKPYVKANIEQLRINALAVPPPTGNFKNLLSGGYIQ